MHISRRHILEDGGVARGIRRGAQWVVTCDTSGPTSKEKLAMANHVLHNLAGIKESSRETLKYLASI